MKNHTLIDTDPNPDVPLLIMVRNTHAVLLIRILYFSLIAVLLHACIFFVVQHGDPQYLPRHAFIALPLGYVLFRYVRFRRFLRKMKKEPSYYLWLVEAMVHRAKIAEEKRIMRTPVIDNTNLNPQHP